MSQCGTCLYYAALSEEAGNCVESPPKVFMVPIRSIQGEGFGFQAVSPQVSALHWCGAYEDSLEEVSTVVKLS